MNKLLSIFLVVLVNIIGTSCTDSKVTTDNIWKGYDQLLSNKVTTKLYAGKTEEIGKVTYGIEQVGNSGYITANYELEKGWLMSESQLFVGKSENMPVLNPESSKMDSLSFIEKLAPKVSSYVQYVPIYKLPESKPGFCIVAKAIVNNIDGQQKIAFADDRNDILSKL